MAKQVFAQIGDNVAQVAAKVKRERAADLELVFPKGALVLSSEANLRLLKRHLDQLNKNILIMTNDLRGREHAVAAGFELVGVPGAKPKINILPKAQPLVEEPAPIKIPHIQPLAEPVFHAPRKIFENPEKYDQPKPRLKIHTSESIKRKSRRRIWAASLGTALLILILVAVFILPQATVTIYARTQPLSRDIVVTVDQNQPAIDQKQMLLPGVILDNDQQISKSYQSTGKQDVGIKASGNVQIYNYSGKTLKFNGATTTFTTGGMVYHLGKDVSGIKPTKNLPGTNNPDPATLTPEVPVIADQNGDLYNLPAGTKLILHNAVLGSAGDVVYAINSKPIGGGISRFTASITQEDLDNAAKDLKNSLFAAAKQQLLNVRGLTLLDSAANVQTNPATFDKKAGDAAVSFTGTVTGHIKGLAFDNEFLKTVVRQRITLTLDPGQVLDPDSENLTATMNNVDLNSGKGTLNVHYQGLAVSKVNEDAIKDAIKGKGQETAKNALNMDAISRVDLSLRPFWLKTVPLNPANIHVLILKAQ